MYTWIILSGSTERPIRIAYKSRHSIHYWTVTLSSLKEIFIDDYFEREENLRKISLRSWTVHFKFQKKAMANPNLDEMERFQYFYKCSATVGFGSRNQARSGRVFFCSFLLFYVSFANIMFIIYEAKTFREYTNSIVFNVGESAIAIMYTIFIFKISDIFDLLDFAQEIIASSEWISSQKFLLKILGQFSK